VHPLHFDDNKVVDIGNDEHTTTAGDHSTAFSMSMLKLGMVNLELVIGRPTAFQSLKMFESALSSIVLSEQFSPESIQRDALRQVIRFFFPWSMDLQYGRYFSLHTACSLQQEH
jgi:hypothetical protein